MPTYLIRDILGRTLKVTRDTPPTEEEARQLLSQGPPPPAADTDSGIWETIKTGGKAALELTGRPGEFVSGFTAGALDKGFSEGVRRGARAAFEPTLTDSKISENMSQVLDERGILKDSPLTRAAVGFVGDVVTDPLNLLGGAGIVRRGIIGAAGKVGQLANRADEARQVARVATGVPIGEAFQRTVVPKLGEGARALAAATPGLRKLQPYADLIGVRGTGALDAQQVKRASDARKSAAVDAVREEMDKLRSTLTPDELTVAGPILSRAISNADPAALQQVAADPKLSALKSALETMRDTIDDKELFSKSLRQLYLPVDLKTTLQTKLNNLTGVALQTLRTAVAANDTTTLPPELQKLGDAVLKQLRAKDGTLLYDPKLLRWASNADGVTIEKFNSLMNYVPVQMPSTNTLPASIFRGINPALREGKERALSFAEAQAKGAETDIFKIMEQRAINSARAEESARLIDEMATSFGSATPQPGFVQVSPTLKREWDAVPALAALKNTYFPPAVARELERVTVTLSDPATMEGVIRRGLKLFKAAATSLNLTTYPATNFLGNVLNMHLAGMNPAEITQDLVQSTRAMRKFDDVAKTGGNSHTLFRVPNLSDADVLTLARERGVVGRTSGFASEFVTGDTLTPAAELLTTGRYNPINPENPLYNTIRGKQQQLIEDPAKLALFSWQLRNGATPEEAQMAVFKYLFNYADLSPYERQSIAGSIIPFYTWTRKNVPLWLGSLATRPQRVSQQRNLLELIRDIGNQDPESAALTDQALPSYLQRGDQINLPSPGKTPVRGRLRMPLQDINTPFEMVADPKESLGNMLNPALRIPYELFVLRETMRGEPIYRGMGPPTPLGEALGLAGTTPFGGREQSNLSRYLTNQVPVPSLLRPVMGGSKQGSDLPQSLNLLYRALGLSPTEVTPSVRQSAVQERQRKQADRVAEQRQAMRERLLRR